MNRTSVACEDIEAGNNSNGIAWNSSLSVKKKITPQPEWRGSHRIGKSSSAIYLIEGWYLEKKKTQKTNKLSKCQ